MPSDRAGHGLLNGMRKAASTLLLSTRGGPQSHFLHVISPCVNDRLHSMWAAIPTCLTRSASHCTSISHVGCATAYTRRRLDHHSCSSSRTRHVVGRATRGERHAADRGEAGVDQPEHHSTRVGPLYHHNHQRASDLRGLSR
jgi:hypothetical protein